MTDGQYLLFKKLNNRDFLMLKSLYYFRCLSITQLWDLSYKSAGIDVKTFTNKRIIPFSKYGIITVSNSGKRYTVMITNLGIELLSAKISLNNDYFDVNTKKIRSGILKENTIKILPKFMEHQIALNQFVIDFNKLYRSKGYFSKKPFIYFDEKFVSKYSHIRPDGMISFPSNNTDFFLEMDMGTESQKQLKEKWANYRLFLSKNTEVSSIKVFFILDGINPNQVQTRKDIVKYTLNQTMTDDYENDFEVYVGTKKELLTVMFDKVIPELFGVYFLKNIVIDNCIQKRWGFLAGDGAKLKKVFYNIAYRYYIRKINERNRIKKEFGKIQEFMFDDYIYEPFSVLNKIQYHAKHSDLFRVNYKRDIGYIVLVKDLKTIFHDLQIVDAVELEGIYYTTIQRMMKYPPHKALVQFDKNGGVYHFTNMSLSEKILEENF